MVANTEHGKEGEGKFELSIYSTDPKIKATRIPPPKDFPQWNAQIPGIVNYA